MEYNKIEYPENKKMGDFKEIWLAGGCFWGTEEYFSLINGVVATATGYANGTVANPTYNQVCTGETGFAESVYIQYNSKVVSLSFLLEIYYKSVNPHLLDRQGGDIGNQYRTGIYYLNIADKKNIDESMEKLKQSLDRLVVIEVLPLSNFYLAEDMHQAYLKKNPAGYCHIPTRLFDYAKTAREYKKRPKEELEEKLTKTQYNITQENGTEPPFENEYNSNYQKGIYVSITTGEPLFISSDKFDSGCGWPSFSRPIEMSFVTESLDESRGMSRTEIRSKIGDDHLGHVFSDGIKDMGGLRYCINSAALRFIPLNNMEKEGYKEYIALVK